MAEESVSISFRVPLSVARDLESKAAEGQSKGDFARQLVLAALAEPSNSALLEELQVHRTLMVRLLKFVEETTRHDHRPDFRRLADQLHDLKEGLATGVHSLLVRAGGASPDEAEEWVRTQMYSPPQG